MKREKIDLSQERKIIINMIMSSRFLREIAPVINTLHFQSSYVRIVCGWILEYWEKYKDNPGKHIQDIYEQKRLQIRDEDDLELVADFLSGLSAEWKNKEVQNVEYTIGNAVKYLKLKSLDHLKSKIEKAVYDGNTVYGEQAVANYERIERGAGEGVGLLTDPVKVATSFMSDDEILFSFPGRLGEITGHFLRGDLVSFLAASNRGKTWWQWYLAQRALSLGYKVVFFTLEMPINQIVRRAWQSLIGSPRRKKEITIPYFFPGENEKYLIKEKKILKEEIDLRKVKQQQKDIKRKIRSGDARIISLPAYSSTVDEISAHIDNLEHYNNYLPDVVVVDYADIIRPTFKGEYRHQLDDIWKRLRRMAQERNVLVVTASQADRASFKKDAGEGNIAEDIRKLTHVSKMIALNQKPNEYEKGFMRVKLLKERDGRKSYKQVVVLQCLDIGRPYLDSRLESEVEF